MELKLEGLTLGDGRILDDAGAEVGHLDLVTGRTPDRAHLRGVAYRIERAPSARRWQVVFDDGGEDTVALATAARRSTWSARYELTTADGRRLDVAATNVSRTVITATDPATGAAVLTLDGRTTWTGTRWQLDATGLDDAVVVALWWIVATTVRETYGAAAVVVGGAIASG